jgi:glycerol uptake facilitator-like aquaporin
MGSSQLRVAQPGVHDGRRILDLAEGVLMGLRRYSSSDAFEELVGVASRHGLSVSVVAAALVSLAAGETDAAELNPAAALALDLQWSQLLSRNG